MGESGGHGCRATQPRRNLLLEPFIIVVPSLLDARPGFVWLYLHSTLIVYARYKMIATEEEPPIIPVTPTFEDFDNEAVYKATQREASSQSCGNFVVEFGKQRAQVARDLEPEHFQWLLDDTNRNREDYPVRWM
jgi:hypothetical protein